MPKARITFNLLGYWHMGSGNGDGASLDALVIKTEGGLPYIPGRTVKGLLREGVQLAEDYQKLAAGTTLTLFGGGRQDDRFGTRAGELFFSNASLGQAMEEWAAQADKSQTDRIYRQLTSTGIDKSGQADYQTLRKIEVSVPMQLEAEVETEKSSDGWLEVLQVGAALMRQSGVQRHRGLGRVQILVEEVSA